MNVSKAWVRNKIHRVITTCDDAVQLGMAVKYCDMLIDKYIPDCIDNKALQVYAFSLTLDTPSSKQV